MFTRDFRKLRLALAAVGSVALLYAGLNAALMGLARWTEARYDSYPWRNEDYLRYLLPSLFEKRGSQHIILMGPSEAREDLLYERFEREFPGAEALQAAQSLGTFEDVLLSLEYIEKVYGPSAMPDVLILGITPRFVGNIPRDNSPLVAALNRYSPYYRVEETPFGPRLVPKGFWAGLASRVRFVGKQPPRYLAAVSTLVRRLLNGESAYDRWLRRQSSPYKYQDLEKWPRSAIREWLNNPNSFWFKVHAWNPEEDAASIQRQFARLLELTERREIRLYIVNLPEIVWNRERYRPGYYERYLALVQASIGRTPFLNLRDILEPEEFYDIGHATLPGAIRVTDRVVEFIKNQDGVGWR